MSTEEVYACCIETEYPNQRFANEPFTPAELASALRSSLLNDYRRTLEASGHTLPLNSDVDIFVDALEVLPC
jgi:hypothetical protein